MTIKWVCAARRAMLACICMSPIALPAYAQDALPRAVPAPAAEVPTEEGAPPASVETLDTAAQGSDQEIIVTARRRTEVLQDVLDYDDAQIRALRERQAI